MVGMVWWWWWYMKEGVLDIPTLGPHRYPELTGYFCEIKIICQTVSMARSHDTPWNHSFHFSSILY